MAYNTFSRSALRLKKRLLRPLLTSHSGLRRRPFRHKARSPQVRTQSFPAQPPDLRSLILDPKSFAIFCSLALIGFALYPVLVHRLAVSIHASYPHSVALVQLRFTSFAVVSLRRDFHPQDCAHAGRTKEGAHLCPSSSCEIRILKFRRYILRQTQLKGVQRQRCEAVIAQNGDQIHDTSLT